MDAIGEAIYKAMYEIKREEHITETYDKKIAEGLKRAHEIIVESLERELEIKRIYEKISNDGRIYHNKEN